jgi:hypothetical protein
MKSSLHKKTQSEKNLFTGSLTRKNKIVTWDPFQSVNTKKKIFPILKPICHRRVISDNFIIKPLNCESARNTEVEKFKSLIYSPRVSQVSSQELSPIKNKNSDCNILKTIENPLAQALKSPYSIKTSRNSGSISINSKTCKKIVVKANKLILSHKKRPKNVFDFSFGNK